jgi:hypothetical protein
VGTSVISVVRRFERKASRKNSLRG